MGMKQSRYVILAAFIAVVAAASACTQKTANEATDVTKVGLDKTKAAADTALAATKENAGKALDQTEKVAATTSEAMTDGWITAKVSAKFADEKLLKGSHIDVHTDSHIVTLKGLVASAAVKTRAVEIAAGTDGVVRVVNRLVVE